MHMEVHVFVVQRGSKLKLAVNISAAICQQPGERSSNSVDV